MDNSKRRIPTISQDRIDDSPISTSYGNKNEDIRAKSFIQGKEPVHALTLRLPVSMHRKLKEIAYKKDLKITKIILDATSAHIKKIEKKLDQNEQE